MWAFPRKRHNPPQFERIFTPRPAAFEVNMKPKKILSIFLLLSFALAAVPFAFSAAASSVSASADNVIRVGFFPFSGYHIVDENGNRSGYGYDFLQLLARYGDWTYEYVGYDGVNEEGKSISHDDCLAALERGDLDVVTSTSKNPDREERFLFSEKDIGTNSTIFTVRAGNPKHVIKGDYRTYTGLKIGMLENNSKNAVFEEFAEEKFTFEKKEYESEAELTAALAGGEVDGIVTGSLRSLGSEWLIESLSPQPFYLCVNKGNTELKEKIDDAIDALDLQEPDWRNVLHDKYYSTDRKGNVVLDAEERAYLDGVQASGKKLTVLMNPDRRPYSYFENGEAKGIFPAVFAAMTANLSSGAENGSVLPYEYIAVKDRAEYAEKRKAQAADIVIDFGNDFSLAEADGYKITDSFFSSTHTLIKRRDHAGAIRSMATLSIVDNTYSHYLADYVGAGVTTKQYSSLADSIRAVREGECDATIALSYVAELFIWEDERGEFTSELIGEASSSYTLGVRADTEMLPLLSILNKCVAGVDRGAVSAIVTAEVTKFRPEQSGGILYFLRRNPGYIAVIAAGISLLLIAVALLMFRTVNQRKLQKKVAEATAQLEQQKEELSVALHAADAANRSKTTFLNNMSHDIRTPMNAIIGFTALATTHLDNRERTLDYLTKISQSSNHLLSLINDVLDMSRIESGKVHIEDRPENLADILQGIRNIIQSDIHAKQLELFIDTIDVTHEEVYCDKLRLNQILLNLTSNAIKFTGSGGSVFIKVTQKPSQKAGYGVYEFSVSDTGIGMSAEFAKTVFEPFTRERNSTVSGIQGTGLGMAITKNIVDIMGGTITVKSEQGKGSEFTVTLELRFADEEPEQISLAELNGLYSLVVDDDLVSCQSVSKMLRQIGMHAEWTVTGREAIVRTTEAIELGHPFGVYIIDWSMPDMDGIATVKGIRSIIGDSSPIILMSAYDWADIEQDARAAGVTGFVSKPLFASDLHRALERNLGKTPVKEAPAQKKPSFGGKRLLLAEDNELNREIAEELLAEAGFMVESAENGKIALEMVERAKPGYYDLILMDVQMPIMNGYEATKQIRALKDKALASIPIVAMTANAFEEDKANAFAAGMNGHLAKPIDIEKVLALLEELLGGGDGSEEGDPSAHSNNDDKK